MKNTIASLLLAAASTAVAVPALAGPDAVTRNPQPRPHAASSGERVIAPTDDIVFAHDSHAIDASARQQLANAAAWVRRHADHRIVLEGYADSTGTALYNEDLATRRATNARDYLATLGVPAERVILVVYGESTARPGAHPLDRRVVMYATDRPAREVVEASLQRHARHATWSEHGRYYAETRTGRAGVIIGTR